MSNTLSSGLLRGVRLGTSGRGRSCGAGSLRRGEIGLTIGALCSSTDYPSVRRRRCCASRSGRVLARRSSGTCGLHELTRGFVHVTTRQNIQFHFVQGDAANVLAVSRRGSRSGACGNAFGHHELSVGRRGEDESSMPRLRQALAAPLAQPSPSFAAKFQDGLRGCARSRGAGIHDIGSRGAREPAGRPASVRSSGVRRPLPERATRAFVRPKKSWAWRSRS